MHPVDIIHDKLCFAPLFVSLHGAMDQSQQRALNALEPYLSLAKSATSPQAATQVVTQATSAPQTFVFSELLQTPNIQALDKASIDQRNYLQLLYIFSWGTWQDYLGMHSLPDSLSCVTREPNASVAKPGLPKLSDIQAQKLRQLSLLTLSTTPNLLTYSHLQEALSLDSTRALEDLVISTIYAGLITAKLDTVAQRVDVSSVAPLRDLRPGSVPELISVLQGWDIRCLNVLQELEGQMREVRSKALRERQREEANEKATTKLLEEKDSKGKSGGKRAVGEEADEMEIDENNAGLRTRNAKRGGAGMFKGFSKRLGGAG